MWFISLIILSYLISLAMTVNAREKAFKARQEVVTARENFNQKVFEMQIEYNREFLELDRELTYLRNLNKE